METKVKNLFRSYIFEGIAIIVLGILMLIWPQDALKIMYIVFGGILIAWGLFNIIAFILDKSGTRSAGSMLSGIIKLALGIAFIVSTDFFITIFQYIVAIILIYGTILMIVRAASMREIGGGMFILAIIFAVLFLILAGLMFVNPKAFASAMVQIEGISLIVEGLSMIIVLRRVKTVAKEVKKAVNEEIIDTTAKDADE